MEERGHYNKKGVLLGFVIVVFHKILIAAFSNQTGFTLSESGFLSTQLLLLPITVTSFGLLITLFITSDKVANLFRTGIIGLMTLISAEIALGFSGIQGIIFDLIRNGNFQSNNLGENSYWSIWFITYFFGIIGSIIGLTISIVLTVKKIKINVFSKREDLKMEKSTRIKLLLYGLVTAMTFTYLILPVYAGISVPIFTLIQFICLWFVVPDKKRLWLFLPIFILSLNSFISGNSIWRVSNFIIILLLYMVMFTKIDFKDTSSRFISNILFKLIEPLKHIELPFKWLKEADVKKASIIKRVILALLITIPLALILIAVLSKVDPVFSKNAAIIFKELMKFISFNFIFKVFYGLLVGFYLFGLIYSSYLKRDDERKDSKERHGDLIILNVLLISILAIYTIFVAIQFRYLFAGAQLPYNLTYTEYARRGFFELFGLTGVNIITILITIHLTKSTSTLWGKITKWLCCYFCAITIVLLASSFYRMFLYNESDGLTRLRYMVFGFLIFEGVGLLITFFYIFKPKFNIVAVYLAIALLYYVLLNIVPMDYFVAKSQIDRYIATGDKSGLPYATTLSTDAASQVESLITKNPDKETLRQIGNYFMYTKYMTKYYDAGWQRYNLSIEKAEQIYKKVKPNLPVTKKTLNSRHEIF